MGRRVKSLHHNLGDKNVVFHREHRTKKNRRFLSKLWRQKLTEFKRKKLAILTKELDDESINYR
jgi:hypothetical protein